MAVTKILARKGRLDIGIDYILNGDKTEQKILTAHQGCEPGRECRQMLETKRRTGKMDGVQYYHIVQSFKPGEISPELALEIAKTFAAEHLDGYEAVIATHVDRGHIHSHIVFNSVNADTGEKYHSNPRSYYCLLSADSCHLRPAVPGARPVRDPLRRGIHIHELCGVAASIQGSTHLPLHAGGGSLGVH